jgi:hypothetical protein
MEVLLYCNLAGGLFMAAAKPRRVRDRQQPVSQKRQTSDENWQVEDRCERGRKREFTGTLMGTFNFGEEENRCFSVPKKF